MSSHCPGRVPADHRSRLLLSKSFELGLILRVWICIYEQL
jgi:hypothetical protein